MEAETAKHVGISIRNKCCTYSSCYIYKQEYIYEQMRAKYVQREAQRATLWITVTGMDLHLLHKTFVGLCYMRGPEI